MEPFDSPEEAAFRSEARYWLEKKAKRFDSPPIAPSAIVAEWSPEEEEQKLAEAKAWQRVKFEAGWAGIAWPRRYGGRGGTLVEAAIFSQEEAAFDVPRDALAVGLGWCGPAVLVHGDEAQKDRLIPPLLRGDEVWSQLFSEPAAGSDLAGLQTRAVRDGDEWVLSGQKLWTTFAHRSDWGLAIARHDPELPKHRGLTAFIVDMRADGVECRPVKQMTKSSIFNEVFLDGVRVPDAHRIGEVGDGWRVVITTFMYERHGGSFGGTSALAALRRLIEELELNKDPVARDRFTRVFVGARVLGYSSLRMLTALSQGRVPGPEGSIAKLAGTHMLSDLYELAVMLMGPGGMLDEADAPGGGEWQGAFLGTPGLRIGGGTDQIQRNIIGERLLGLPPEVRVDKEVPFKDVPSG